MKKERLRRLLALCIFESLGHHKISFSNVKRYVTSDLLSCYTIRRNTKIADQDIRVALQMITNATRNNPTPFRFAPSGSLWGIKREKYFLHTPLTDLM